MSKKLISAVFISLLALIYLRQRRGFWAIYADRPYILGSSDIPAASVAKPIDISKKRNKADFLARIKNLRIHRLRHSATNKARPGYQR